MRWLNAYLQEPLLAAVALRWEILGAVMVVGSSAGLGVVWHGSQPATPTEIKSAVAELKPAERERFVGYLHEFTLDPRHTDQPFKRRELQAAVGYAKNPDPDAGIREAQGRALHSAFESHAQPSANSGT